MEDMSSESTEGFHCGKTDISWSILSPHRGVIQSQNAAKVNGSQPDWDAKENGWRQCKAVWSELES